MNEYFYTVSALKGNKPHDTLLGLWVAKDVGAAQLLIEELRKEPRKAATKFEISGPFFIGDDLCEDRVCAVVHLDKEE
jgi:hypothetical protein